MTLFTPSAAPVGEIRQLADPVLDVWVDGTAQPKGSKTAVRRGNKIIQIEAADFNNDGALSAWTDAIAWKARTAWGPEPALDEPVHVVAEFRMPRPGSHLKPWSYRRTKPDADKLLRAVLDALETAEVLQQDSRCADVRSIKRVCEKGEEPGVRIRVWQLGLWESAGWIVHVPDHPVMVRTDGGS